MKVCLPYRGEFGFNVMMHAPMVNAIEGPKVVVCERGNEALYPTAAEIIHVGRRPDEDRRARMESEMLERWIINNEGALLHRYGIIQWVYPDHDAPRKYFVPSPLRPTPLADAEVPEIVLCPRDRFYGSDKNWPHWKELSFALAATGRSTVAVGAPDSSKALGCPCLWEGEQYTYLDETLAAMLQAKLVIATDAGLAHLAVQCGARVLLITHGDGLVAPGADDKGKPYWSVMWERFRAENHTLSPIYAIHNAWEDMNVTLDAILGLLKGESVSGLLLMDGTERLF